MTDKQDQSPIYQIIAKYMLLPVSVGQGMEEAEVGWGHEAAVLRVVEADPDLAEAD